RASRPVRPGNSRSHASGRHSYNPSRRGRNLLPSGRLSNCLAGSSQRGHESVPRFEIAMLTIEGTPALSPARLAKRLALVNRRNPRATELYAEWIHFVDASSPLDTEATATLERLLVYGPKAEGQRVSGTFLLVVPRIGTISPWSSKATDIAHLCGLSAVRRIERGVAYTVAGPIDDERALRAALHDRMTESVLAAKEDAQRLFGHGVPRPKRVVELGSDGKQALERANGELGLALSPDEIEYLVSAFGALGRSPTDVELMMFAQ